jgi:hypothetical protein
MMPLRGAAHGGHERCFTWAASAAQATVTLATPIRIIHLHHPVEQTLVLAFGHRLHQLVLEQPGGVVGHAQVSTQCHRRDAVLVLGEQVDRQEPRFQRQFGLGEERSCGERDLMLAAIALEQVSSVEAAMTATAASGALKALRPALLEQHLAALRFSPEAIEERGQAHARLKLNDAFLGHGATPRNQ